jgi:hypothetical protein
MVRLVQISALAAIVGSVFFLPFPIPAVNGDRPASTLVVVDVGARLGLFMLVAASVWWFRRDQRLDAGKHSGATLLAMAIIAVPLIVFICFGQLARWTEPNHFRPYERSVIRW